jgi:hypothetical protein
VPGHWIDSINTSSSFLSNTSPCATSEIHGNGFNQIKRLAYFLTYSQPPIDVPRHNSTKEIHKVVTTPMLALDLTLFGKRRKQLVKRIDKCLNAIPL